MNIYEAAKEAIKKDQYMVRPFGEGNGRIKIKPTNNPYTCCLVFDACGHPCRRWVPEAKDLIAEDWKVTEE